MLPNEGYKRRVLVIRLSALGDVAILQPIVKARALANPDTLFIVAAPGILMPLFKDVDNIRFMAVQKRQNIFKLYQALAEARPDIVADMHHVNRVVGACWLFKLHGIKVKSIRKERWKRRQLTRKRDKKKEWLKPSWQRYDEVFDACGLDKGTLDTTTIKPNPHDGKKRIGIAPFAQHRGKIWPEEKVRELIALLSKDQDNDILLFGSRQESARLEEWSKGYGNVTSIAGRQAFECELKTIASLDVMVSMDSANMHFASCYGVPVVSIWGATHKSCGFYGWRQDKEWCIEREMVCRPCSMFGNKPCLYGDYKCLTEITAKEVADKIREILYGE